MTLARRQVATKGGRNTAETLPATCVDQHEVLRRVLAAHEAYFDVYRDYEFKGRVFPGYAEFHSHAEKYVLVKRAKLWGASAHEYLFFCVAERLSAAELADAVTFMTTQALDKVQPDSEHMTSYLSLVVIARCVDEDVAHKVRATRFRKNFKFGLQGWVDLRLAVIDLSASSVLANARGKELRPTLAACAFGPNP